MSEIIEDIYSGFESRINADSGLASWLTGYFGAGTTFTFIEANTPVEKIAYSDMPAIVEEIGDSDSDIEVSGEKQRVVHDLVFAAAWHDSDPATAFTRRKQLHDLMIKAMMADGTLGVAGASAHISEVQSDRNAFHPIHVMRFTLTADWVLDKP